MDVYYVFPFAPMHKLHHIETCRTLLCKLCPLQRFTLEGGSVTTCGTAVSLKGSMLHAFNALFASVEKEFLVAECRVDS